MAYRSTTNLPRDGRLQPVGVTSLRDAIDAAFSGK